MTPPGAAAVPESEIYRLAIQGGSFAVLVLIVVWFLWKGLPKALEIHQSIITGITERHASEMATRDAAFKELVEAQRDIAAGLKDVVYRLERLEQRTDLHRPLPTEPR